MQKFVYPQDYLAHRGNIKQCWEVHKRIMSERGLPYVDYSAFYARIRRCNWDLYRAIHTPLDYRKLEWHEKIPVKLRTWWLRFIYLFKKHDRRRRS